MALRCPSCATEVPELTFDAECPKCGALLDVSFPVIADKSLTNAFTDRRSISVGWQASGVWRYRELVAPSMPSVHVVSLPEGNTPLISSEHVSAFARIHSL